MNRHKKAITEAIIILLIVAIQIGLVVYDLSTHKTITGVSLMPTLCVLVALVIGQAIQTYTEVLKEENDESI